MNKNYLIKIVLVVLLFAPLIAHADLLMPYNPGRSPDIDQFFGQLFLNFYVSIGFIFIILNALIARLFVYIISKFKQFNTQTKIKKSIYLLFSTLGYVFDKIFYYIAYHTLGVYKIGLFMGYKKMWDYEFNNNFNVIHLNLFAGFLIFIAVSIIAYILLANKLYSDQKKKIKFSIICGLIINPWWWRLFFDIFVIKF